MGLQLGQNQGLLLQGMMLWDLKYRYWKYFQLKKSDTIHTQNLKSVPSSVVQPPKCHLKKLPAVLFPIIQEYSNSEKDYRNLMNTSLSIFQSIKWETVRFSFYIPEKWTTIKGVSFTYSEAALLKAMSKVKVRSKQISLMLNLGYKTQIKKYARFFKEIDKFHLVTTFDFGTYDLFALDIFNNIHHVILETLMELTHYEPAGEILES
jgi:hypothetical protein